jgi:hypothetical protein
MIFNEEKHEYIVNGKVVPSVSEIMKCATCLYYTDEIPPRILELACIKGSAIHKSIEEYLLFDEYSIEERYQDYMNNFLKWLDDYKPEIIKVEYKMTNGEFAGTCDLICKIDNKIIGIDHKTSSQIHTKMIAIQESGYDELCDIKIDEWYVLHLTKKDYEFKKIELRKDIWNKCKDIYFYMKGE